MIGPFTGGVIADAFGGFSGLFQGCAVIMLLIVVVAATMRPPKPGLA
jgi:cyanate permease